MGHAKRKGPFETRRVFAVEVEVAIKHSMEHPEPCLLCGEMTQNRGVYVASNQKKDKIHLIYAFCRECLEKAKTDPTLYESIEETLGIDALSIPAGGTEH